MSNIENFCLVTAQPEFIDVAIGELKVFDKNLSEVEKIAADIILCETSNAARLMSIASDKRPTFARHIAPVQTIIDLNGSEQDIGNIALSTIELPGMAQLERSVHFSVQTRLAQTDKSLGERAYTSGQINRTLAEALAEETGAVEDIKKPQIVISLLCTMQKGYLGISTADSNLSSWPGGTRHYSQTKEQVSRAEFKLLEALEVFNITLPSQGQVLDLGAAPGGWTRLLLEAGLQVIAVDPARLDSRLDRRKGLEHYRGYAEDYLADAVQKHKKYDLVVNDMRMDAREAARLLGQASTCLRSEDGFIVSILKLPHATIGIDPFVNLKEALNILRRSYNIVQVRQLFHNRQEVTVVAAQPIPLTRRR
ncbi:SAM-dependent methyltransferase [Dictyobacter arantiisoli]|uniref:Ribosomal RNA methyltransferase FtsJ domain-containing protein n=1 Tax=Dictyobacter arantiisoli TaxID=2014874 RepID=A0A5A5TGP2_9CHLR|nr:SAM-dependent methyltransferase [Dictyobacter arantiisoli]GCF10388.1 hypothetical protein KDI_39520 [Dictyobacter arantiisoli]